MKPLRAGFCLAFFLLAAACTDAPSGRSWWSEGSPARAPTAGDSPARPGLSLQHGKERMMKGDMAVPARRSPGWGGTRGAPGAGAATRGVVVAGPTTPLPAG